MTQIKSAFSFTAIAVTLLLGACGSDDDNSSSTPGNSLVSFQGSACKKESGGQALTANEAYAGLQCIRWKPIDASTLKIELLNFEGGCGAQWKGESHVTDSGLELRVVNPGCMLAACGSCMYDWSFDVHAAKDADLALSMVEDPCPGQQTPTTVTATLPLSTTPEGELCRYASHGGLGWQASSLGTCGQAYMPCRNPNDMCSQGSAADPCEAGLTCADGASSSEQVCHAPCTTDADCAPTGILTCQTGLCRPAKPW